MEDFCTRVAALSAPAAIPAADLATLHAAICTGGGGAGGDGFTEGDLTRAHSRMTGAGAGAGAGTGAGARGVSEREVELGLAMASQRPWTTPGTNDKWHYPAPSLEVPPPAAPSGVGRRRARASRLGRRRCS